VIAQLKHLKILADLNSNLKSKNKSLIDPLQIFLFLNLIFDFFFEKMAFCKSLFITGTARKILANFIFRVEEIQEMTVK